MFAKSNLDNNPSQTLTHKNSFSKRKVSSRPWWTSGLRRHVISQLIVATEGPRFESCSGLRYRSLRVRMACHYSNITAPVGSCAAYNISPNQEPALELHGRAAPSVEAHHRVNSPDTGRNSRGRGDNIKKVSLNWIR